MVKNIVGNVFKTAACLLAIVSVVFLSSCSGLTGGTANDVSIEEVKKVTSIIINARKQLTKKDMMHAGTYETCVVLVSDAFKETKINIDDSNVSKVGIPLDSIEGTKMLPGFFFKGTAKKGILAIAKRHPQMKSVINIEYHDNAHIGTDGEMRWKNGICGVGPFSFMVNIDNGVIQVNSYSFY